MRVSHSCRQKVERFVPIKVPIQSPVQSLSIGLPSLQLEMRTKLPSSWRGENASWVTGRVCPLGENGERGDDEERRTDLATSGTDLLVDIVD